MTEVLKWIELICSVVAWFQNRRHSVGR